MQTNSELIFDIARRAGLPWELDLLMHCKADTVVQACTKVADAGGGGQQFIENMASRSENCSREDREFIGLMTAHCVRVVGNRVGKDAGLALRQAFDFLPELADHGLLEHQIWSVENPTAFEVTVEDASVFTVDQQHVLKGRYFDALIEEFGDNKGVLAVYEATIDDEGLEVAVGGMKLARLDALKLWEQATKRAEVVAMVGMPVDPTARFKVFTYLTM